MFLIRIYENTEYAAFSNPSFAYYLNIIKFVFN